MVLPSLPDVPEDSVDKSTPRGREVFGILLGLYALILYPILRADRPYNDDLKRALIGRAGWDSNGRPLTTLLMRVLQCYDHAMVDISPLTQIGAIGLLAFIGAMVARRYVVGPAWLAALIAFPLGAQPFFLANLSYKFDALTMCLAMLLALVPILRPPAGRRGWWLGVLALFGSLNLYQPAVNLYLVFVLLDLVLLQLRNASGRELAGTAGVRLLQVVVSMLIYELVVGIHISGWVEHQAETIHGWHELPLLLRNFVDFYAFVIAGFNGHWWLYFGPLLVVLAVIPVIVGVRHAMERQALEPGWVTLLLVIASVLMPMAGMVCALGPMLLLRKPEIEPRVLMGLGALLSAGLVVMLSALRRWGRSDGWSQAAGIMLTLGMGVVASAYGNAMGAQKAYEERIAARLVDDLAVMQAGHPVHSLIVAGSAGYAPLAAHVVDQLPVVRALTPVYLTDGTAFNTRGFLMYYLPDLVDPLHGGHAEAWVRSASIVSATCGMPPAAITAAYRLFLVGDVAVVRFRAQPSSICAVPQSRLTGLPGAVRVPVPAARTVPADPGGIAVAKRGGVTTGRQPA